MSNPIPRQGEAVKDVSKYFTVVLEEIMDNFKNVKKALLDRDGNKCSICGVELTHDNISIDHIFPRGLGGSNNFNNLRLLCRACNNKYANTAFFAYEFEKYIYDIIRKNNDFRNVELEKEIGTDKKYAADIIAERKKENKWEKIVIEIKYTTSLTIDRIKLVIEKFKEIEETIRNFKFILLFPGKLTEKASLLLGQNNIEVWDVEYILSKFGNEITQTDHPKFQSLFTINTYNSNKSEEQILIDKLKNCNPGKENWSMYQKLIGDILSFLFCPPLLVPLSEKSDALKINRRDFIFPNYCDTGFWAFLRSRYHADYIVVDAKNYSQLVTKKEVLQIANYLKYHGTGLFGMIISRKGISQGALYTIREVWAIDKKLIIILQDNDIEQMLLEKISKREPENVIRQKIEDFRLSL